MMSFCRTADPVRDAEMSQQDSRDFIVCDECGEPISKADNLNEGDKVYRLGGMVFCQECIDRSGKECA